MTQTRAFRTKFSVDLEQDYDPKNGCITLNPDGLQRKAVAQSLAKDILRDNPSNVIGIYGSWGAGKSYLIGQIINELFAMNNMPNQRRKAIVCVYSPWRYEFEGDPGVGLIQKLGTVYKQFENAEKFAATKSKLTQVSRATKPLLINALDLAPKMISYLVPAPKAVADLAETGIEFVTKETKKALSASIQPKTQTLHEQMQKLVNAILNAAHKEPNTEHRLVMFIDDLDRCSPENVVRLFEWLKVHLTVQNCVYVLALDHVAAARAIIGRYRAFLQNDVDLAYGFRYLEKLVDSEYEITRVASAEKMAVHAVYGKSAKLMDAISGAQAASFQQIERLLSMRCLNTPRTMLKVISKFQRTMDTLNTRDALEFSLRLPAGYQFWVVFLIAMTYQLEPSEVEMFLRGQGRIYAALLTSSSLSDDDRLEGPMKEFFQYAKALGQSGELNTELLSIDLLSRLINVIRTNTYEMA